MATKLWEPSQAQIDASNLTAFRAFLDTEHGVKTTGYDDLWQFSIDNPTLFWASLRDFTGLKARTWGGTVLADEDKMPGAAFFPEARLNFAENLLPRRDDSEAIVFKGEDKVTLRYSWAQLYDQVSCLAQALRARGVTKGDRVAAYMPNMPQTVIGMLAAASIGATWCSTSPDFGVNGVLDRFGQIEPKILLAVEGYYYNGKAHSCLGKIKDILAELPSVEQCVVVPYVKETADLSDIRGGVMLEDFTRGFAPADIDFEYVEFNHPLYIMFSSGTTGKPKCIIHGTGGTLLKQVCEHVLHCDAKPGDRVFYFTTCGWMMWNWLVAGLAAEATLLLFDGSPFYPDGNVIYDYADSEQMTFFGTSAKYIDACNKAGLKPRETHSLATVRAMASTGSPLVAESFEYVYRDIKEDIHLASISGGTDILGCFVLGNPTGAVYKGEIQCRALGLAVDCFDDEGTPVRGVKGELVCTKPFPSMPVGFWNDPDMDRYRGAYFERFDNIWTHGDFVEMTENGGMIIHGRSDTTLNPGGVRIGTAEIYRQVEQIKSIREALVIGQQWEDDVRVVLFVVMMEGHDLDDGLVKDIKTRIRIGCTPRHVPAKVIAVEDIPRTKSGKITELAVRDVVHGRDVKNVTALANPQALDHFRELAELDG